MPERRSRMFYAAILPALFVLLLWLVHLVDQVMELDLHRFGILPREWQGLWGILFSPFLHGDVEHLFNNSLPTLVLGWALMYFYPRIAGQVLLAAWLISGMWVWISARENYHIGASGVVYGLASFLFLSGVLRRQRTLMALSLLVVFLYGGMVWGLFPIVPRVSWESHFWGAVAGALMAIVYRKVPPAVQDPVREEPTDDEDDQEEDAPWNNAILPDRPMRIVYHIAPKSGADAPGSLQGPNTDREGKDMGGANTSGTWSKPSASPPTDP